MVGYAYIMEYESSMAGYAYTHVWWALLGFQHMKWLSFESGWDQISIQSASFLMPGIYRSSMQNSHGEVLKFDGHKKFFLINSIICMQT